MSFTVGTMHSPKNTVLKYTYIKKTSCDCFGSEARAGAGAGTAWKLAIKVGILKKL
jgi:hypothetical protein